MFAFPGLGGFSNGVLDGVSEGTLFRLLGLLLLVKFTCKLVGLSSEPLFVSLLAREVIFSLSLLQIICFFFKFFAAFSFVFCFFYY